MADEVGGMASRKPLVSPPEPNLDGWGLNWFLISKESAAQHGKRDLVLAIEVYWFDGSFTVVKLWPIPKS